MMRFLVALLLIISGPVLAETHVPKDRLEIRMGFAPVVRHAAPAVVNIYAKRIVAARRSPFQDDPFFRELFRDFANPRPQVQNSLGSGVILSGDGIVVSNYHVVEQATDIRVVLNDRREFSARVLLSDEESDLAILQLEGASNMPALTLRDSDTVEVGELVLAIGNPFGVGQTVSSGIVSGLARSGVAMGNARGYFIQTDAPINPGNSGGALVDINGQLIGVNTWILSRSGGSNGIGFAIPAALIARFVAQAKDGNDQFQRPWAGLTGQAVTADMAEGLGLRHPGGIVISQIHDQSPFRMAGFRSGDVITAVDGQTVNSPAEMIYRMTVAGLGRQAMITRVRDGTPLEISIDLSIAPNQPPRDQIMTGQDAAIPEMTLLNINPAVIVENDLPLTAVGVMVDDPGRVGARAGLRAGDILRLINDQKVTDTEAANDMLESARRRLHLGVQRGTQRLIMRFRL